MKTKLLRKLRKQALKKYRIVYLNNSYRVVYRCGDFSYECYIDNNLDHILDCYRIAIRSCILMQIDANLKKKYSKKFNNLIADLYK